MAASTTEFTDEDFVPKEVTDYFKAHPNEIKYDRQQSHLANSYMREPNGLIYPLTGKNNPNRQVGKGGFGRVKQVLSEKTDAKSVVKIQKIKGEEALKEAMREGALNLRHGVAIGPLQIRPIKGSPGEYKVYQRMLNLGTDLSKKIAKEAKYTPQTVEEQAAKTQKEMQTAIALCLEVDRFHKRGSAHRDIKPENILVDSEGRPRLVDFGTTTTDLAELTAPFPFDVGTQLYMPMNEKYIACPKEVNEYGLLYRGKMNLLTALGDDGADGVKGVTNIFADRIAMLRCLDHPLRGLSAHEKSALQLPPNSANSILSQSTRDLLPASVLALLDTKNVAPHLSTDRAQETEQFFAAVLITCMNNHYKITDEEIQRLRGSPDAQEERISTYQLPFQVTNAQADILLESSLAVNTESKGASAVNSPTTDDGLSNTTDKALASTSDTVNTESKESGSVNAPTTDSDLSNTTDEAFVPKEVTDYFKAHPNEIKYDRQQSHLANSYMREPNGLIYPLTGKNNPNRQVGKGGFGRVKQVLSEKTDAKSVVKIQKIKGEEALKEAMREGALNLRHGVAIGPLQIRPIKGSPGEYKVYQRMLNLGTDLSKKIAKEAKYTPQTVEEQAAKTQKEMQTAIALCLEVDRFHKRGSAHRDIKPENILVDSEGRPRLVDFGTTTTDLAELTAPFPFDVGTQLYMPMNEKYIACPKEVNEYGLLYRGKMNLLTALGDDGADGVKGVTNIFADRIAMLRCLDHPLRGLSAHEKSALQLPPNSANSILSQSTRDLLPASVLALLDTKNVAPHLSTDRAQETEQFFAAVLITCMNNHYKITDEEIQRLRSSPDAQEERIQSYQHSLHSSSAQRPNLAQSLNSENRLSNTEQLSSSENSRTLGLSDIESSDGSTLNASGAFKKLTNQDNPTLSPNNASRPDRIVDKKRASSAPPRPEALKTSPPLSASAFKALKQQFTDLRQQKPKPEPTINESSLPTFKK